MSGKEHTRDYIQKKHREQEGRGKEAPVPGSKIRADKSKLEEMWGDWNAPILLVGREMVRPLQKALAVS